MPGFKLVIVSKGFSSAAKRLSKIAEAAEKPSVPVMQASVWLTGQTIKAFEVGGKPEKWAPIGLMTAFIRAHRESAPTQSGLPLNDSGRLKGSFIPVQTEDGSRMGVATNVEYAGLMQTGGASEARDVSIASFKRRRPGASIGFVGGRQKYTRGGPVTVRPYTMHLKGGSQIPARPFFPDGMGELEAWGYLGKVQQIFNDYFQNTWKSVGGSE